ncbi:hypothetical protein ACFWUQ_31455 [Streptomyces sp. NPDC058662]
MGVPPARVVLAGGVPPAGANPRRREVWAVKKTIKVRKNSNYLGTLLG